MLANRSERDGFIVSGLAQKFDIARRIDPNPDADTLPWQAIAIYWSRHEVCVSWRTALLIRA